MPSCAFRKCNNNTRNTNKAKGITFHKFPEDPRYKEKWIKVIQEEQRDDEWLPTQHSRICSAHFNENEFNLTSLGLRKIKIHAIPVFCPTLDLSQDLTTNRVKSEPCSPLADVDVSDTDSIFDTPREIYLKKKLNHEKSKREKCRKEMLKLKKQNKYLKSKNSSLREIIKRLKKKKYYKQEILNETTQTAKRDNKEFYLEIVKIEKNDSTNS